MSDVLIRDIPDQVLEDLKARAKAQGRSLQGELKLILVQAVRRKPIEHVRVQASALRERLREQHHTDSSELLRDDRAR